MTKVVAYLPTFAPDAGEENGHARPLVRINMDQIADRINTLGVRSRTRPWVYLDAIDSIVNQNPDIELVVADAKSSDIIRTKMAIHHKQSGGYQLAFYPEKLSQWVVFNDILARHAKEDTEYFVYTSSDIIWAMDWVGEAIKEFDKDPNLQILFPMVNAGDLAMPLQLAPGPCDMELIDPADHMNSLGVEAARAPCLNMYAAIFRIDFLKKYDGYPTLFSNCFTESFLYYLCEAMGGKMRLAPRCWSYHHNGIDIHGVGTAAGAYNYHTEKPVFDEVMDQVQYARSMNIMTPEFLKNLLWKKQICHVT